MLRKKPKPVKSDSLVPEADTRLCRVDEVEGSELGFGYHYGMNVMDRTTFLLSFGGIGDMVRAAAPSVESNFHNFRQTFFGNPEWVGREFRTFDDVIKAVDSTWNEGVADVDRMAGELERSLPAPVEVKRRRVWNEDAGDEIDVDRYRHAEPFFRDNAKRPQVGPRVVSLLVQVGNNCQFSSESLKWRGAACVALARVLEAAGYSSEIQCFSLAARAASPIIRADVDGANIATVCNLKNAGDALDISALVNATSGWYFRTVVFGSYVVLNRRLDSVLGFMQEANDATAAFLSRGVKPWLVSGVYDYRSALALAARYLETLTEGK